ncbi:MAG: hypothetical protein FJZ01_03785 [Candidatus Sericytochromatia bacterium]|nr:hypothetical protein [Candidatus Tanganyikabacteria bacterium]
MIAPVVERYHSLVDEAKLSDSFLDEFKQRMRDAKITFGDRLSCHYLRPQLLTAEQYALIQRVVKTLWSALEKLGAEIHARSELQDRLGLTAGERELCAIDPGYRRISPMARFDSFLVGDQLAFVELNAECPAGPAYVEVLANLFLDLPVMQKFQDEYVIHPYSTRTRLRDTILGHWREWGGTGIPRIAIVDWTDVPTYSEFELIKEYFTQEGIPTEIADPRELTYDGKTLRTKTGFEIQLIYKRVLTNEFLEKLAECQAMLQAVKDRAVCMINPFRGKYLHKKAVFALLTAEELQDLFSAEEQEAIRKHIPWTRRLEPGSTVFHGEDVRDLLAWTKANREQLVLKPNDEYGGKGIFVGWTLDDAAWHKAVDESSGHDYLVQEKVEVSYMDFPTFHAGALKLERQLVDLDPYVFEGEVEGCLTRLSGTALANVTAGAGIVPTFVVSPKDD